MMDMEHMTTGMMWGMGFIWLLVAMVLLLAIMALVKYIFTGKRG